ncbi:Ribosomal protein S18 acetylase RimI [Marinitoga hydrogenitolerans DSM 16785]|uniref:Ribosomal protein S18 acetylase RimI n=1 Tax=Marinitoga hydrogenitolerans (strain DSM 16785 / JCM 12826 / AT1271) TaxID=1122195 RepID=A0A1M4SW44_MARH1|nr:GNAT family N-acetyltransferase [Marinitoga hydrogenitolerans]SHE36399.1 Ribosomal protein S18 acetylase RimI [Marinitoga hydrogenitolerans DSM 16785]
MEFKKASEVPKIAIVDLVNQTFKDYTVPINWTITSFEHDLRENSISLDDSYIVYEKDKPIGFSLVSIRGVRGRIDAFGFLKEFRLKGYGSELLYYTTEKMKWKGITKITLEVVNEEINAKKFYQKHGFKEKRILESFIKYLDKINKPKFKYTITDHKWIHDRAVEALHYIGRNPNWQREPKTLELSRDRYQMEKIIQKGFTIGYVVWGTTKEGAFIVDTSPIIDPTKYEEILEDLLNRFADLNFKNVTIVSLPENDPLYSLIKKYEFTPFLKQIEMEKRIH